LIGRFLEISIEAPDILASIEFYRGLGMLPATTGEIWSHRYGVLSDGNLVVGLHDYSFPSPSLTYVRPELSKNLADLKAQAGSLAFAKTADDEFNEAGFTDPDGHMVTVLEARTFSPLEIDRSDITILGHFSEYGLPVKNLDVSIAFWENLGFVMTERSDGALPFASLTGDFINLGLYVNPRMRAPALVFRETDMAERIEYISAQGYQVSPGTPVSAGHLSGAALQAPEGTWIYLLPETDAQDT
jgi:catechol 2,3-dioxygenase-like lactoylglutathione lyase family enzyme